MMAGGAAADRKEGQMNFLGEMMARIKKLMGGAESRLSGPVLGRRTSARGGPPGRPRRAAPAGSRCARRGGSGRRRAPPPPSAARNPPSASRIVGSAPGGPAASGGSTTKARSRPCARSRARDAAQEVWNKAPDASVDAVPREPPASGARSPGRGRRRRPWVADVLADQRAVRVADQQLGLAQQEGPGSSGRLDARSRVPHGAPDDLLADRAALGLVAVEQARRRRRPDRERELPGEVVGVLDAGVHALGAGGRVDVRGIAGHEDPAGAVAVDEPVADPEDRRPAQVRRGVGRGASRSRTAWMSASVGARRSASSPCATSAPPPGAGTVPAGTSMDIR